jgi:apolipoprotein N-acyltransferase
MRSIAPPNRAKRSVSADRSGRGLALLSGVLLGTAFLPAPLGFFAWFALVPLFVALESRTRSGTGARGLFGLGYLFGLAFYGVGMHWIAFLSDVATTVPWLKYPAWLAAAAYLAIFPGLITLACGWIARRTRVPLAATIPFVWLVVEELRGSGELGFPWFQPGYSQHAYVPILKLASLGGVTLVTAWLVLLNVLIWRALFGRSRMRAALGAVLALLLPWTWGLRALDAAPQGTGAAIALIQGNIPGEVKWSGMHEAEILKSFIDLSRRAALATPRPTIVIWPETATGSYLLKQLDQRLEVARFAAHQPIQVFTGFADYDFDSAGTRRFYNAAGLFRTDGTQATPYAKRHLVPFGERMPFQSIVPALGRLPLGQAEWTPGRDGTLFDAAPGRFGCLICFESIFPDLARGDVRAGARWLVNVTNDEWFGNSAALYQHAAMAAFRAVENHVPLARCANTGLTLIIDANGRVVERLPVFKTAYLTRALPAPGRRTWFTRIGDWPGVASVVVVAWMLLAAATGALTRRTPRL